MSGIYFDEAVILLLANGACFVKQFVLALSAQTEMSAGDARVAPLFGHAHHALPLYARPRRRWRGRHSTRHAHHRADRRTPPRHGVVQLLHLGVVHQILTQICHDSVRVIRNVQPLTVLVVGIHKVLVLDANVRSLPLRHHRAQSQRVMAHGNHEHSLTHRILRNRLRLRL